MKYKKYIFKPLLIIIGILVLLYSVVFIYVSANKKSILLQVSKTISEKINGDVSIKNIELSFFSNFPRVAVEINNVSVKDSMYAKHKHAFFEAKKVVVYLSVTKLIQKDNALKGVAVEDGQLYLYTDTTGYTNRYLTAGKKDSAKKEESSPSVLKQVKLKNFRFIQQDLKREKMIDISLKKVKADIGTTDSGTAVAVEMDAHVQQLGFNLDKGAYLINKKLESDFKIHYNHKENRLNFKEIPMDIDDHRFNITGDFVFGSARTFDLKIETKDLTQAMGLSVLTKRLAKNISKFKYEKALDITAHIIGPLNGGEPYAHITWAGKGVTITTPYAVFTDASFKGSFNNEQVKGIARNDENSRIEVHALKANWEGFNFVSDHIYIDNLTVPMVQCDVRSDFSLATLNHVLQSRAIELQEGSGSMNIKYKGPLVFEGNVSPNVVGSINIKNGLIKYVRRNIVMNDVSAGIQFAGTDVAVKDMRFNVRNNSFTMHGSAAKLLTLIKSSPDQVVFDWNIFSPELDLGSFVSLLQPAKKRVVAKKANSFQGISNSLDNMLEKGSVRLRMKVNKLHYKKFHAENVNGSVSLNDNSWTLNNVGLAHAGGTMNVSGTIGAGNNLYQPVNVRSQIVQADVKQIMFAFNDFGQTGIESKNLTGKLNATANISMLLNSEQMQPSNMKGVVDFSLRQGSLINYEPMQKLRSFFKNRDMSHIYFAELKNRLDINDKEITINRMEIQSTAISLFVEGTYSLKGNTDISIQIPLNNVKRRDSTYIPTNIGTDAKAGMSLYVRGKPGSDGKIKFAADVFKKFRKKETK